MKKMLPIVILVTCLCLCAGCQKPQKNKNNGQYVDNGTEIKVGVEQVTHLDLEENQWFFIGEDDREYGYGKVVFFDSSMKVMKYFDNAVLPNNTMGEIDTDKPIIIGQLDGEKRKGATAIDANQYTYGLYNLKQDTWIIPMEYNALTLYDNGCYGAYLYNKDVDTTSMIIYDKSGSILCDQIDVSNSYISCLGENLWNISYDGEQSIQIYDKQGNVIETVPNSYGIVHGGYYIASNTELGDVIYNSDGKLAITKETVVKKGNLHDVDDEIFFVIDYNDFSNMIEAQLGKYQLILDNTGNVVSCIDQEIDPNAIINVQYWVYCITKTNNKNKQQNVGNELSTDDVNHSNNFEDKGIVTDKENPINDKTRVDAQTSYYDKSGRHLYTSKGREFEGHIQPYGESYIPHNIYLNTGSGFEIYDYESKETYVLDIGDMGIVEIQSPMKDYFLITNELDEETNISLYYKNTLIAENTNLLVQVLNDNLVLTNYSEEYVFDEISMIYNQDGKKIYESPCYEMIEEIGEQYILAQREGIRTIVDYDGNVIYSFDKKIEMK